MNTAFNILVVPSIILIVAALLTAALRRASASLRHEIWVLAIFGATFLPAALFFAPKWEIPVISRSTEVMVAPLERRQREMMPGEGTTPTARAETPSQPAPPDSGGEFSLGLVWCVGAVAVFVRFLFGILAVRRLVRHANVVDGEEWRSLLGELRSQLAIRRKVRLVVGAESFPPMTWGNVILLPGEAQDWNSERRRLVLAHELAHVRRRDGLLQSIVQLTCAAYWFNPLVWLAAKRLRMERERACDDQVLNLGVDGPLYASHLVEVARVTRPRELSLATVSMAHPSQLETRIRAIMDSRTRRHPLPNFAILAGDSIAAAVLVLLATVRITATAVPALIFPPPPVVEVRPAVVLVSKAPAQSPAVPVTSQTDLERIWSQYGRPNSMESHRASRDGATYADQIWTYYRLPGLGDNVKFEFIDPAGTGEYRLAPQFNPPAVHFEQAKWAGTWKLNKDQSTFPQESSLAERFRSIESLTITFEPVSGGVTVTADATFIPSGNSPDRSRRTKARIEYTVMFGEATNVRSIIPFMDQDGFVKVEPTSDGLKILSSTGTGNVRNVETVTFSASNDGRTLTETVNVFPGVIGIFERQ